jgi:uncharacterized protein YkwD
MTNHTASLALVVVASLAACTRAPVAEAADGAPPGPSSFLPTGRVDVIDPWTLDEDPAASVDVKTGFARPPPAVCGDGTCGRKESCTSCAADCGACPVAPGAPVCGDAICAGLDGELCTNCADCATTANVCGNGACQAGETSSSCRPDCGGDPWPSQAASDEAEVLRLINQHRAAGTDCPTTLQAVVPPLTGEALLQQAARLHSWDQSFSGYVSHTSCNGRTPWTRAADVGTTATGETIAWGYDTPAQAVDGWMRSQGHCAILMSARSVVGIGRSFENGRLWTAMFR